MANPKTSSSKAIANWDEELAAQAQVAAAQEASSATGQFFSMKSGVLSFNGSPIPNNEMAVVILDSVFENVFYEGAYNQDQMSGPTCYAFGRDEPTLAPYETVISDGLAQHDQCRGCPLNEYGTAETGKGKACRNTRRLALIPAGTLNNSKFKAETNAAAFEKHEIAFMKLPVTSVKGYAAFVKQVAGAVKRPPYGIFTKIKVVPDKDTQFAVTFEMLGTIPNNLAGVITARHEEAEKSIVFPYAKFTEEEAPKKSARGKTATKPAVKGKTATKPAAGRGGRKY